MMAALSHALRLPEAEQRPVFRKLAESIIHWARQMPYAIAKEGHPPGEYVRQGATGFGDQLENRTGLFTPGSGYSFALQCRSLIGLFSVTGDPNFLYNAYQHATWLTRPPSPRQ